MGRANKGGPILSVTASDTARAWARSSSVTSRRETWPGGYANSCPATPRSTNANRSSKSPSPVSNTPATWYWRTRGRDWIRPAPSPRVEYAVIRSPTAIPSRSASRTPRTTPGRPSASSPRLNVPMSVRSATNGRSSARVPHKRTPSTDSSLDPRLLSRAKSTMAGATRSTWSSPATAAATLSTFWIGSPRYVSTWTCWPNPTILASISRLNPRTIMSASRSAPVPTATPPMAATTTNRRNPRRSSRPSAPRR